MYKPKKGTITDKGMKLLSWDIPPLKQKRIFTRVMPTITEIVLCNTPENSRFEPKSYPRAKEKSFELKTVILGNLWRPFPPGTVTPKGSEE